MFGFKFSFLKNVSGVCVFVNFSDVILGSLSLLLYPSSVFLFWGGKLWILLYRGTKGSVLSFTNPFYIVVLSMEDKSGITETIGGLNVLWYDMCSRESNGTPTPI